MASEARVLTVLRGGALDVGALSKALGLGPSEAGRVLARLKDKGKVRTKVEGITVVWEAV